MDDTNTPDGSKPSTVFHPYRSNAEFLAFAERLLTSHPDRAVHLRIDFDSGFSAFLGHPPSWKTKGGK